jgi:hypothetical protein
MSSLNTRIERLEQHAEAEGSPSFYHYVQAWIEVHRTPDVLERIERAMEQHGVNFYSELSVPDLESIYLAICAAEEQCAASANGI